MCQHSRELLCHVLCKDILKCWWQRWLPPWWKNWHCFHRSLCLWHCWLFGQSLGHSIIRQLFFLLVRQLRLRSCSSNLWAWASRASWSRNCASFESSGAFPLALGSAALGSAAGSASWMVLTQPCFGWKIQYSPFHHTGLSIPSLPVLGCTPFRKLAVHAACLRPLDRL